MSEVVIIALTNMRNGNLCVGAVELNSLQMLRLSPSYNPETKQAHYRQPSQFALGQVWDITYVPRWNLLPPHMEDVNVLQSHLQGTMTDLGCWVRKHAERIRVHTGGPSDLLDGILKFSPLSHGQYARSAYLSRNADRYGTQSLCLWIPDQTLIYEKHDRGGMPEHRFSYIATHPGHSSVRLKYSGIEASPLSISANTLLSVSLARWWSPPDDPERMEQCTLQLCNVLSRPSTTDGFLHNS